MYLVYAKKITRNSSQQTHTYRKGLGASWKDIGPKYEFALRKIRIFNASMYFFLMIPCFNQSFHNWPLSCKIKTSFYHLSLCISLESNGHLLLLLSFALCHCNVCLEWAELIWVQTKIKLQTNWQNNPSLFLDCWYRLFFSSFDEVSGKPHRFFFNP